MSNASSSPAPKILAALVLAAAAAGVVWYVYFRRPQQDVTTPTELFQEASAESGITFRMKFLPDEQGAKFKINLYDHGCGVAVGDYDGDGHDDVFFCNQLGRCALYRNKGDGTFEDKTDEAGVGIGDRICVSAVWADYDNDGRQDLFVTSVRGGNILFHNEGGGKFKDVTKEAGLDLIAHCQSAHFFDFDNDGDLDLLVTCTAKWTQGESGPKIKYYPGKSQYFETAGSEKERNHFYRNDGNGKFTEITQAAGLKGLGWAADAAILDYDGDNFMDVIITNMFGRAQLYRNTGKGSFVDVTKETLDKTSWGGMGVYPFDFNNDGKLDLYIVDMHSDMWMPFTADLSKIDEKQRNRFATGVSDESSPVHDKFLEGEKKFADLVELKYDDVVFGNSFFKNLGKGKFVEMSDKANLETFWPWGIACGDFDNNGFEDVYVPSGMGYPFSYWRNYLMMNYGKETFEERTMEFGMDPPKRGIHSEETIGGQRATRSSRAAAVADFNGDGKLDIIVNNFNDTPYYWKNIGPKRNYVAFRLTGTKSNRDAVGAVVRLYAGNDIMTRQVNSATGYLAQSSRTLHFGLGDRTRVDRIEITWPGGSQQTIKGPEINKLHRITEAKE